jgi:VWFA-related protein
MSRSTRFFRLLTVVVAATASGLSQSAPPKPASASPAPTQTTPAPVQTINAKAQLVVLDVVVADSKQTPVHNLKATDFVLLDNNSPQQITGFEEHVAPAHTAKVAPMRPLPPGIFTNFSPVPEGSTVNVLLLDALNTPMKDQSYVRDQLREYLKNTPPGTRIAIFGLNDRLIMLQGFTSDLTQLKSVVERSSPGASLKLADNVGNGGTQAVSEMMSDVMLNAGDTAQLLLSVQEFENVQGSIDTQIRVKQTLDAMNQLAHYLAGIPGRKNLIWFSGSFPLDMTPQPGAARPFDVVANSEDEFRETTSLLARSQVAIYPIDVRGLTTNATSIAKASGATSFGKVLAQAQSQSFQKNADEHSTMTRIAADTGGTAYIDSNGLSAAVGKAIENGSNYYTLSYTPTDSRQNGEFHKIQVKLAQQSLNLTYRSGYYADIPKAKSMPGPLSAATPAPAGKFVAAMMRGAPDATEILLKLQVLPASNAVEKAVVPGNIFNTGPASKLKVKGPFRRYAIDIATNAKDVQITPTPDGHFKFSVEVLTCVYDIHGDLINTAVQRAHGNLSLSSYANLKYVGLPFHQEISVPVSGEYYLRISVHDLETDRYGSVEIPVASVAKLTALATPATGAPPASAATPR